MLPNVKLFHHAPDEVRMGDEKYLFKLKYHLNLSKKL